MQEVKSKEFVSWSLEMFLEQAKCQFKILLVWLASLLSQDRNQPQQLLICWDCAISNSKDT